MNNNTLISLLENILQNLRNNKYNTLQLTYLSSIIQKFSFLTQENRNLPSNRDLLDFLSLGWYIYTNIDPTQN